jgi:hypothetical protein
VALDFPPRQDANSVAVFGLDLKHVFQSSALSGTRVTVPTHFHRLPDFRPSTSQALSEALAGLAPKGSGMGLFDPLRGPFSSPQARQSSWAQSLEFLRDIKLAAIGSVELSQAWLATWLEDVSLEAEAKSAFLMKQAGSSTKADRLIWRARRILNGLSHGLAILPKLDSHTRGAFWSALIQDIAKISAPTDTLWASLKDGFDPLSPRALWLRAVAILGVECAFPGFLRADLVEKSVDYVHSAVQKDGLMKGGSIIATLSAGADLSMLARLTAIEPVLGSIRLALASLRRDDGTLVTFGVGAADYVGLLGAVIGPGEWKPSTLLLDSSIGRMSAKHTSIWMRASQAGQTLGPACDIGYRATALLKCMGPRVSAPLLPASVDVVSARCRRRDEPEFVVLEASASLIVAGHKLDCIGHIRLSLDGRSIQGEYIVRSYSRGSERSFPHYGSKEIHFGIDQNAACHLSRDQQSVLIVTSRQQAWRFRAQGMDIVVEKATDRSLNTADGDIRHFIVCRYGDDCKKEDFSAAWQLTLEEIS